MCRDEILSPAKFSISVHNAAAGAASQIVANRAGHTAIAAGFRTLTAGLTEAWSRIASGAASVIFVYADLPLMGPYREFDEPGPGVHLAVRLVQAANSNWRDASGRRRPPLRRGPGPQACGGRGGAGMAALSQQSSEPAPPPVSLLTRLERIVRLITTAISFAIFGLGGLILALIVFPLLFLFIRDHKKRAAIAQACLHRLFWLYVRIMQAMGTLTFECDHPEILRDLKGAIVIANHPSLLDVVFLMSFMRHTRAVVKSSIWRNPFMRGVVIAADYIPNSEDPPS